MPPSILVENQHVSRFTLTSVRPSLFSGPHKACTTTPKAGSCFLASPPFSPPPYLISHIHLAAAGLRCTATPSLSSFQGKFPFSLSLPPFDASASSNVCIGGGGWKKGWKRAESSSQVSFLLFDFFFFLPTSPFCVSVIRPQPTHPPRRQKPKPPLQFPVKKSERKKRRNEKWPQLPPPSFPFYRE